MLLEVSRLVIEYKLSRDVLRAVDDVSFQMKAGETLGIVGESGSGKSTLAAALLGLLGPSGRVVSGSMAFEGRNLLELDRHEWRTLRGRRMGMIFQSPRNSFSPNATIGRHIEEALHAHFTLSAPVARVRALEALDLVRMPRASEVMNSYAFELSGGMCQRAALAIALALEPSLLVADEPTSSLDLLAQVEIATLLEDLRTRLGLSMIIVSHDIGLIGRLSDRVAVMHRGEMVEIGMAHTVLSAPAHARTAQMLSAMIRLDEPKVAAVSGFGP